MSTSEPPRWFPGSAAGTDIEKIARLTHIHPHINKNELRLSYWPHRPAAVSHTIRLAHTRFIWYINMNEWMCCIYKNKIGVHGVHGKHSSSPRGSVRYIHTYGHTADKLWRQRSKERNVNTIAFFRFGERKDIETPNMDGYRECQTTINYSNRGTRNVWLFSWLSHGNGRLWQNNDKIHNNNRLECLRFQSSIERKSKLFWYVVWRWIRGRAASDFFWMHISKLTTMTSNFYFR